MEKQKLSNFYIPNESKRFVMSDIQGAKLQNIEESPDTVQRTHITDFLMESWM